MDTSDEEINARVTAEQHMFIAKKKAQAFRKRTEFRKQLICAALTGVIMRGPTLRGISCGISIEKEAVELADATLKKAGYGE